MALITYADVHGSRQTYPIPWQSTGGLLKITIGTDPKSNILLPEHSDVLPQHALITRARAPVSFVLLDLTEGKSKVNEIPIIKLKALRHLDTICLGNTELTFMEIHVETLQKGSPYIGKPCMAYGTESHTMHVGDDAIICRCGAVYHRECWFKLDRCATDGCWYPIHSLVKKRLAGQVKFQKIEKDSELTTKRCSAGQPGDERPFQEGQEVLNCPKCFTPFHSSCWLLQETCPECGYIVRELTDTIFWGAAGCK